MHRVTAHGTLDQVHACIDSNVCTVCMLVFSSILAVKRHVMEKSPICKLNLLRRGEFLTETEVHSCNSSAVEVRRVKKASGKHSSILCCRSFGPLLSVFKDDDSQVQPYRGNPLGKRGPLRLPPHLLLVDEIVETTGRCPASLRKDCIERCLLCSGFRNNN